MTEEIKEIKFEKALERLEKIVEDLEAGNIELEDALKKYEEGVRLARACQKKLDEAEKKVEILTRSLDGTLKREAFQSASEEEGREAAPEIRRPRKSALPKETPVHDEDLLI